MKERPILFNAQMVRALLAGTKTQTRRIAKPVKHPDLGNVYAPGALVLEREPQHVIERACPYGQPGDRLWVREAWKAHTTFDHLAPRDIPQTHVWYMADDGYKAQSRYRNSMFMPRWASRITLEVTGICIERLQDITEDDAAAEGAEWTIETTNGFEEHPMGTMVNGFAAIWESINGPGSWDANPWVWVVEFKRVEGGAA